MRSRDRECAHHHNGEDLALKGKMSIFAVFFLSDPYQVRPWSAFVLHPPPTTLSSEIDSCKPDSPRPSNPYIFWKLLSRAIQRRQRDTNTKTMTITNTKTKTKTETKTKRLKAALPTVPRPQTHTFSESSCQELFKNGNVTQIQRQWQLQIRRQRQRQRQRDWKLHFQQSHAPKPIHFMTAHVRSY